MMRRTIFAVFLGILVGVAIGYSPLMQPSTAPKAQLLMQQEAQPNVVSPPELLVIAVLAGLIVALPVFLLAGHRAR